MTDIFSGKQSHSYSGKTKHMQLKEEQVTKQFEAACP